MRPPYYTSPHTHTQFVDGKSTAEQMVNAAIERGLLSIGFSEHARQPIDLDYGLSAENEQAYIAEIKRLREKYSDRIRIWLGCERDAESVANRLYYDYVIGSSHYLVRGDEWYSVDGPLDQLIKCRDEFFGGFGIKMARAYYERFSEYIEEFAPDIIGHFDLVRKNNEDRRFFDEDGPEYRDMVNRALERMVGACDLMEVNTGGIARGTMNTPYPRPFILKRWRELGGRVIISSDCHRAEHIDTGYEQAEALIRDAGYRSIVALGTGEALFVEHPLS